MSEEIQNTPESTPSNVPATLDTTEPSASQEEREPEQNSGLITESVSEPQQPNIAITETPTKSRPSRDGQRKRSRNERGAARPGQRSSESRPQKRPPFERFVVVTWSGMREPVDDMYWAEAEREGDWIIVRSLEPVRTRREILERLTNMPNGLAALEFHFGYPKNFVEFLTPTLGIGDWRSLTKRVREDLKKNVDDGVRIWIERMGAYRESQLDPDPLPNFQRGDRRPTDRRFGGKEFSGRSEPLPPYEQRSVAERFRRTDLTIRKVAGQDLTSPIQIAYNRLTKRYEFSDTTVRGRASLLGMSMLDQLIEARPEVSIWPMSRPKAFTVAELQPWVFTNGRTLPPEELRRKLALYEDNGWDIPASVRDTAARNGAAQRALLSLIGIIQTEMREERERRPLRDYVDQFYSDPQVQLEGWFYSIGYRMTDDQRTQPRKPLPQTKERRLRPEAAVSEPNVVTDSIGENPIANEPTAEAIQAEPVPESAEIQVAEE
jgi:hypothetical protein